MSHLSEIVLSVQLSILQFGSQTGVGNLVIVGRLSLVVYMLDGVQCCFKSMRAHVIEDDALQT